MFLSCRTRQADFQYKPAAPLRGGIITPLEKQAGKVRNEVVQG